MFGVSVKRTKTEKAQEESRQAELVSVKEEASRQVQEKEYTLERMRWDIAKRVRIGHRPLDVINLTAKARGEVETSVLITYDGEKLVVTAHRLLTEPEYNRLVDVLGFTLNRT